MNWDLTHLYKSDEDAIKDIKDAVVMSRELLKKDFSKERFEIFEFEELFKDLEKTLWKYMKPLQYASLKFSKNMKDEAAQKLFGMIQNIAVEVDQNISVLKAKFAKLPDEVLGKLKAELIEYSHFVEKIILNKKHTLSEDAEKVLAAFSNTRRDGVAELYEKMVSSYIFEIDGKKMTGEEVRALRYSKDGNLRKKAMEIFFNKYKEDSVVIEGFYNLIVKDWDMEAKLRGYEKPISMRNLNNEVEDHVVEKLIDVTSSNTHIVEKYYRWKAKYLGEELTLADIYAPLSEEEKKISFEEAKKIVLEAYYEFSEISGKIVESFFDENRIDVFPAEGKRGGAFCSYYVPDGKPYVLLNFTGKLRDVMTLAHELGHGLHGTLSSKQNVLNYHTPLTMAEIASVFGEFLVFDKMKSELSGKEKVAFIGAKLEDIFATMFRQNMFVRFEIRAHERAEKEGFASFKDLSEIYAEELKGMFGDSVKITEEFHREWSAIPHFFFAPFYVYAYNFANALVIALYQKYLEEGKKFVPKYIALLESGGSKKPEELLKEVGIDVTKEDFWQKAFEYIDNLTEEIIKE